MQANRELITQLRRHKKTTKLSNFEIGLNVGVSQSTIAKCLDGFAIKPENMEKINSYLNDYVPPKVRIRKLESAIDKIFQLSKDVYTTDFVYSQTFKQIQKICIGVSQC